MQVWDFQLQKSRGCDEPRVVTFDGLEVPKSFQDVHNMNYSTGDDILSRNVSHYLCWMIFNFAMCVFKLDVLQVNGVWHQIIKFSRIG